MVYRIYCPKAVTTQSASKIWSWTGYDNPIQAWLELRRIQWSIPFSNTDFKKGTEGGGWSISSVSGSYSEDVKRKSYIHYPRTREETLCIVSVVLLIWTYEQIGKSIIAQPQTQPQTWTFATELRVLEGQSWLVRNQKSRNHEKDSMSRVL